MERWRCVIEFGEEAQDPRVSFEALEVFLREFRDALREELGAARESPPALYVVGIDHGCTALQCEVGDLETGEAVERTVGRLHELSTDDDVDVRATSARHFHSAFSALKREAPSAPVRLRILRGETEVRRAAVTETTLTKLQRVARRLAGPADNDAVCVVGKIYEINADEHTFRVRPGELDAFTFRFDPLFFPKLDEEQYRWKRVTAKGIVTGRLRAKLIALDIVGPADGDGVTVEGADAKRDFLAPLAAYVEGCEFMQPGWDTYDAVPLDLVAVSRARDFLEQAFAYLFLAGARFEPPFATPTPRGSLQLEWEDDRHYLELEFAGAGAIEAVYERRGEDPSDSKVGVRDAIKLLLRFAQESAR